MRRKKKNANKSINLQVLPLVHPNAAGIDVGAKEHVVAVRAIETQIRYEPSKLLLRIFTN